MRNGKNIGHIVRDKRATTSLSQITGLYLLPVNSSFIKKHIRIKNT